MTRFDEVRATFWGGDPYGDAPPLTDAAVRDAGRRPGVRLPASLLGLLRDRDGGVVADAWDACELPSAGDFRTFVEGLTASAPFHGGQD
ncbi:hypothetical protein ABZ318_02095 [Streptomyces sp. NPDC006197]|uniref:hypothetical protein n=1 Tax=Streptomyces sp. NPDC006197 TaxID=3156685 RepID=UPI0033AE3ED1